MHLIKHNHWVLV